MEIECHRCFDEPCRAPTKTVVLYGSSLSSSHISASCRFDDIHWASSVWRTKARKYWKSSLKTVSIDLQTKESVESETRREHREQWRQWQFLFDLHFYVSIPIFDYSSWDSIHNGHQNFVEVVDNKLKVIHVQTIPCRKWRRRIQIFLKRKTRRTERSSDLSLFFTVIRSATRSIVLCGPFDSNGSVLTETRGQFSWIQGKLEKTHNVERRSDFTLVKIVRNSAEKDFVRQRRWVYWVGAWFNGQRRAPTHILTDFAEMTSKIEKEKFVFFSIRTKDKTENQRVAWRRSLAAATLSRWSSSSMVIDCWKRKCSRRCRTRKESNKTTNHLFDDRFRRKILMSFL